jgi:UDP-glucuronate decarboxylase
MSHRILLTGGTGFFGRALLRYIISSGIHSGCSISVLSRQPDRFRSTYPDLASCANITFVQGDMQVPGSLPWGQSYTHVLHAATDSTFGPCLAPLERFNHIVEGSRHILDLAVSTGATRFLLTSSGGIYGLQPPDLDAIPEEWLGSPSMGHASTAYSQAKRAAEHLCALYGDAHGIETVIARCFAFVGPDLPRDVHFAIGNFIRDALQEDSINIKGDGKALRTYLDQRDLAHWLWTLLLYGKSGEAYNVGSDCVISISQLANLVRDLLAPRKPVVTLRSPIHSASQTRYVPCINKIRNAFGLRPEHDLVDAILTSARGY